MGYQSRVEAKTKDRKFTRVLSTFVILGALLISGYYVFTSTITEGAYKIYVGNIGGSGTNNAEGIKLTYDPNYGKGYSNLSGKGIRTESNSLRGMSFSTESLTDSNGKVYKNCLSYLMSVASNDEKSIQTNVTDKGQSGEANGDEFLASKFFLMNDQKPDPLNGKDGVIHYAVKLEITENTKNALGACRFALIEVHDESKIFNYTEGTYDNSAFTMNVIAQPKQEQLDNGDTLIYNGSEENSNEFVSSSVTGDYTNTPDTVLLKNPNKGQEKEDWKCVNLHYDEEREMWYYDSLVHETSEDRQVFHINPESQKAYVVAAWYEASDPNHNNEIMGGYVSFNFTFYAVEK